MCVCMHVCVSTWALLIDKMEEHLPPKDLKPHQNSGKGEKRFDLQECAEIQAAFNKGGQCPLGQPELT